MGPMRKNVQLTKQNFKKSDKIPKISLLPSLDFPFSAFKSTKNDGNFPKIRKFRQTNMPTFDG